MCDEADNINMLASVVRRQQPACSYSWRDPVSTAISQLQFSITAERVGAERQSSRRIPTGFVGFT